MVVIFLIVKKTPPLIALLLGTLLGAVFALIFQPEIIAKLGDSESLNFFSGYKGILNAITIDTAIETSNESLNDLFSSGGMAGMLGTIWLIICAMVFGGIMDAIGALSRISRALLNLFHSTFGLFSSTVISCLALNATASDQYLAIDKLVKQLSKTDYVATRIILFTCINWIKMPLFVAKELVTVNTLLWGTGFCLLVPLGAWLGVSFPSHRSGNTGMRRS